MIHLSYEEQKTLEWSRYIVLSRFTEVLLQDAVNEVLDFHSTDWACAGGVTFINGKWVQALEKKRDR